MNLTRVTLATASSVLLLATLVACGDSSSVGSQATDQSATQSDQQAQAGGMPVGGFPGASGLVAAVSGRTAQVRSAQSGQVAVSWTSATTFTQQVDGALGDVTEGTCVMVTSADSSDSSDSSGSTAVTAATVRILPASDDGSCGFGGGTGGGMPGGGEMPSGAPSDLPTDMPTDLPSDGAQGGRPGGGLGTVGEVAAVSADGFTVSSTTPTRGQDSDSSADPVEVTVTVSGDTTYTATADATAAAVKSGVCVAAQGDTDDTGALTATSISVTKAVDGECTTGFGGGMGGSRPGAAS